MHEYASDQEAQRVHSINALLNNYRCSRLQPQHRPQTVLLPDWLIGSGKDGCGPFQTMCLAMRHVQSLTYLTKKGLRDIRMNEILFRDETIK